MNSVYVNGDGTGGVTASPYTAKPGDFVLIGTDHGNVTINLPVLAANQSVEIQQDQFTAYNVNIISLVAPAAVAIAKFDGTFTAAAGTYVLPAGTAQKGIDGTWYNGGSLGGYSVK